jgi:hypothetical protein
MNRRKLIFDIILAVVVMIIVIAIIVRATTRPENVVSINDADLRPVRGAEVAPEENAFTYLSRATNAMCYPTNFYKIYACDTNEDKEWDSNSVRLVQIIASNETAFAEIEKALVCQKCQLPEMTNNEWRVLVQFRNLFHLLCLKADWLGRIGREADSLKLTVDTIKFGQVIENNGQGEPVFMMGSYFKSFSSLLLEQRLNSRVIPSADMKRLTLELSSGNYGVNCESLKKSVCEAYAYQVNRLDEVSRGRLHWPDIMGLTNSIYLPFESYMLNVVETKSALADLTRETIHRIPMNYSQMHIKNDPDYELLSFKTLIHPNGIGKYLIRQKEVSLRRVLEQKCLDELNLEAIALLAALKAFKQDNARLPQSLDELVPSYMESVPLDPFDGKPMRYSAAKKIIYSVGKDLKDSGGSEKTSENWRGGDVRYRRRYSEDIVYRIEF